MVKIRELWEHTGPPFLVRDSGTEPQPQGTIPEELYNQPGSRQRLKHGRTIGIK